VVNSAFTDETLSMLKNHQARNADDPLFLYLAFNAAAACSG